MRLTVFFLLFLNSLLNGQNLVPNPSFEQTIDTISKFTADDIHFNSKIQQWTSPNTASPDLITPEFEERFISPPPPHSGSMMIGMQTSIDWGEYIGVNLLKDLDPDKTYKVSYWIRRADCINPQMDIDQLMNENFGILFLADSIKFNNGKLIYGIPQIFADTELTITNKEWVKVEKHFTPEEKYSKLYLGQFRKEGQYPLLMKGYFVIDDISVVELTDYEALFRKIELPVGSIIPLDQIYFITGTTDLKDKQSATVLKDLAACLNANSAIRIRINGHTDSKGSSKSNLSLSERRAKFIAQNIIQNGISKDRIEWKGFGEEIPIADNKTEIGRSKNRRVEFEIIE